MRSFFWLAMILAAGLFVHPLGAAPHTEATLLLSATQAKPGDTVLAGVRLKMEPKWHTYWRNGGDSGIATRIQWTLPTGVTAGEIQWPTPKKFLDTGLTTYIYEDEITLIVPLQIAASATPGNLDLSAKVSWLECSTQCIPGKGIVTGNLIIGSETKPSPAAAEIEAALKNLPTTKTDFAVQAWWEKPAGTDARPLLLELTTMGGWDFYPYKNDAGEVQAATESVPSAAGKLTLRKLVTKSGDIWPKTLSGILVKTSGDGAGRSSEINVPIGDAPPMALPPGSGPMQVTPAPVAVTNSTPSTAEPAAVSVGFSEPQSFTSRLLYAFLGGMILNIMPCVLPVISLKILGFVQQSKGSPGEVRKLGLVYGLGVLTSFLTLALIVIAVQKAGRFATWGMQFQDPRFLIVITTLVVLVALNLFGIFEVSLGGGALGTATELASKEGPGGAFFNGLFATVLATSCSAPFLGTALGYAFTQPANIIVLFFLTAGLGLALPYIVLSWNPAWLKFLPKPGAWMEKFKIAMGFPMLGAAIWLFTQTFTHYRQTTLWFGLFLILLSFAAWIWGEFVQRGHKRRGLAQFIVLVLVVGGYGYALEKELQWRTPPKFTKTTLVTDADAGSDAIHWQTWSSDAVAKARAEGHPVLVDFTADWCLTCQVNKRTSIEIPSVRAKMKAIDAVALLGDYTQEDAAIAGELRKYQRAGVPLVVVYPRDPKAPAFVLPEALTPSIVLDALEQAAK